MADLGDRSKRRKYLKNVERSETRVIGPEHPDSLQSMNRLAVTYNRLEPRVIRSIEAAKIFEEYQELLRRRVFVSEHTNTLWSMN